MIEASATISTSEAFARERDARDPLSAFRDRFYCPPGTIYLDGNSLGLLSRDAEAAVLTALDQWKRLAISGWLQAEPPWFTLGEHLGALMASLVGAAPDEVVVTGSTTVNLHNLVATFYQPTGTRRKIVATALDFPSDIYALQQQIVLRGGDPDRDLVLVQSHDGRTISEADIIAAMSEAVALVVLPSVLYQSGQLLDLATLTRAARDRGIPIGLDCAHSVGCIPHHFDAWDADFAFWCTYKYLNAGPGSIGALYVNRRHFGTTPGLAGWWGYRKERQFDMLLQWQSAENAGAWQISTPPIMSAASLLGSLRLFAEAGIERIREKSLALTSYLIALLDASGLTAPPYSYTVVTPREPARRGGHVAIAHAEAPRIVRALKRRGVIPDFRPPDMIRLAPVALYTSFYDVWLIVQHLRDIIDTGEDKQGPETRELVA